MQLMIRFLKEIYLTLFTIFFRLRHTQSAATKAGRAIGAIVVIEGLILMSISSCIEMFIGHKFLLPKAIVLIVLVALCFINQYILFTRGYGIKFDSEFDKMNKMKKFVLMMACLALMLIALIFFIVSTLAYSRFFHAH
jgi:small-conductance mechanosensitive channel